MQPQRAVIGRGFDRGFESLNDGGIGGHGRVFYGA
jgi:hypothetical protein